MTRTSIAVIALLATTAGHAAPPPPARVELPIREVDLSDGARRYEVPVTVGGVAMEAGLDTGSTGLRVLAPRLPAPPRGGSSTRYSYSGGLSIEGRIAKVGVQAGGISGTIPAQLIDKLGCTSLHPDCAGKTLGMADFGLQGDGLKNEGFPVILGINMAGGAVTNPLVALGVERWIVELPRPGGTGTGRVILNPSDAEVAGFTRLPLIAALAPRTAGVHDALPGCLVRTDTSARLCGPVMFDSGAPGLRVSLSEFKRAWPDGTPGQLVLESGGHSVGLSFVSGRRDQGSGMAAEKVGDGAVPHISAGVLPYFGWSVLYEPKAGSIGIKPR